MPSCSLPNLCLWDNLYRCALFPASKTVMGIVCLNEPHAAVMTSEALEQPDFGPGCDSKVIHSAAAIGLTSAEWRTAHDIATRDDTSEILPKTEAPTVEAACDHLSTNYEMDTHVHRNFLGDLTNTAARAGCCLTPFLVDGNFDVESKQFALSVLDSCSSKSVKKNLGSLPLDNTVAILPLSSVTKSPTDGSFSSTLGKTHFSHSSLSGLHETITHLDSVHLCDFSDSPKQCTLCNDVGTKSLSFPEDCNDVFVTDEETTSTHDHQAKIDKAICPHSKLAPQRPLQNDDHDIEGHDPLECSFQNGLATQLQNTSTPPVNIGSSTYLSIRNHAEVRQMKRLSRCRTPSDNQSFASFGSLESQRIPIPTIRRKSLESLDRVCSSDADDPSDNSDFTVHVSLQTIV